LLGPKSFLNRPAVQHVKVKNLRFSKSYSRLFIRLNPIIMVYQPIDVQEILHIVLISIIVRYLFHLLIMPMIPSLMLNLPKSMFMLENAHYYLLNRIFKIS
jgi:hypothetical protein